MSLEIKRSFARVLEKTKPLESTRGFEKDKNSRQNYILKHAIYGLNIAFREFFVKQKKQPELFHV